MTGTLWLEDKWALAGDDDVQDLQAALGATTKNKNALRAEGLEQLAERLSAPRVRRRRGERPPDGAASRPGFLGFDPVDDSTDRRLPGSGRGRRARRRAPRGPSRPRRSSIPVATTLQAADVPTVVADVWVDTTDGPGRAEAVQPVRDSDLARTVSTVDDLDQPEGPATVVLAMSGPLPHPADGRGTTATAPTPNPSRIRSTRDPMARRRARRRLAAAGLVAVVVVLSVLSVFVAAVAAGAATPRTGRVLIISLPERRVGRLRRGAARPTSTGCSSSRPSAPWSPTGSTARRRSRAAT